VFGVFDGHGGRACADYSANGLGAKARARLERITTMRTGGRPRPRGGRGGARGGPPRARGGGGGGPAHARRAPPAAPPSGKMMARTVAKLFTDIDGDYLRESPDAKDGTTATMVVLQDQSTLVAQGGPNSAQPPRPSSREGGDENETGGGFGLPGAEDGGLQVVVANVGDSNALLVTRDRGCIKGEEGEGAAAGQLDWIETELSGDFAWVTTEHNASQSVERERVRDAGGLVLRAQDDGTAISASLGAEISEEDGSQYRVVNSQGFGLAVTRALGDFSFKPAVSAEPTCMSFRIPEESSEPAHSFLCIASDGLWGDVTPEEVAAVLLSIEPNANDATQATQEDSAQADEGQKSARDSARRSNGSSSSSRRASRRRSAKRSSARPLSRKQVAVQMVDKTVELTALALARGCTDNITIMVIDLYAAKVALRGEMEATLKSVRQVVEGSGRGTSMRLSMGKPGSGGGGGRSRPRRQSTLSSASSLSIIEGRKVSLGDHSSNQSRQAQRSSMESRRRTPRLRAGRREAGRESLRRESLGRESLGRESLDEMDGWGGTHYTLLWVARSLIALMVALSVALAMMSSKGRQVTRRAMAKLDDVRRLVVDVAAAS
jgi:serine/threonine protein phosphatase PrpC